jgi:hypothetical protein
MSIIASMMLSTMRCTSTTVLQGVGLWVQGLHTQAINMLAAAAAPHQAGTQQKPAASFWSGVSSRGRRPRINWQLTETRSFI